MSGILLNRMEYFRDVFEEVGLGFVYIKVIYEWVYFLYFEGRV